MAPSQCRCVQYAYSFTHVKNGHNELFENFPSFDMKFLLSHLSIGNFTYEFLFIQGYLKWWLATICRLTAFRNCNTYCDSQAVGCAVPTNSRRAIRLESAKKSFEVTLDTKPPRRLFDTMGTGMALWERLILENSWRRGSGPVMCNWRPCGSFMLDVVGPISQLELIWGSGPYPLIAAEILGRSRIHWSEYWTWTQYKLVPHCQWRWGPNYGVQIKPCSKRIAHTVGKHDFQYLLEYLTGKAKLQICTADIRYFDSRLWMHGRGSWYIKTRLYIH